MVLDYLKVLLSGPVIIGVVVLVFIRIFRSEIGRLIDRVRQIKFPGGEVSALQQARARKELVAATAPTADLVAKDFKLPTSVSMEPGQAAEIIQLIQSERTNAALWEYRYLNLYLVRSTQMVLGWLAGQQQPVSLRLLDSMLQPNIPDPNERAAILGALQTHHLVAVVADAVRVTDKGREYLQWRGPLPPIGAA